MATYPLLDHGYNAVSLKYYTKLSVQIVQGLFARAAKYKCLPASLSVSNLRGSLVKKLVKKTFLYNIEPRHEICNNVSF